MSVASRKQTASARARASVENVVRDNLGVAIHTALRKASDHEEAHNAWVAIQRLPPDEWRHVLAFALDGLFPKERDDAHG